MGLFCVCRKIARLCENLVDMYENVAHKCSNKAGERNADPDALLETPMNAQAFKFIPVPSAWYDPKLEEIAANIEIKINALPDADRANDRCADLQKAFDLIAQADDALANAEYHP